MVAAVMLREGHSAAEFRREAARSNDANQARRLLALAAIRDGKSRTEAARIGGMDRQTLCDWVHAYNEHDIEGLINAASPGRPPKLTPEQKDELKAIALQAPDPKVDGVVRWRRSDLKRIVKERFAVDIDEDSIGRILREMGFVHISPRPRHPAQEAGAIEAFKKTSPTNSTRRSAASRPKRRSRSGFKTRCGSARRTAASGSGP